MHTLLKEKISVLDESNTVSFEEAQGKVENALNNISQNNAIDIDTAFDKVLKS